MSDTTPLCRILFVDDEASILFAVRDYFGSQGYIVDVTRDADEAETLLTERDYAVVIIDLRLGPGEATRGLQLVDHVRTHHPATAVVLFSAFGTPEVEREAQRLGAIFMQKPVPLQVIGSVIERRRPRGIEGQRVEWAHRHGPTGSPAHQRRPRRIRTHSPCSVALGRTSIQSIEPRPGSCSVWVRSRT